MPPKPSNTLEQHIRWGEIRKQKIGVNIHALFDHLRGHQHTAVWTPARIFSEPRKPEALQLLPPEMRETGVEQGNHRFVTTAVAPKMAKSGLRFGYSIANPQDAFAPLSPAETFGDRICLREFYATNRHLLWLLTYRSQLYQISPALRHHG